MRDRGLIRFRKAIPFSCGLVAASTLASTLICIATYPAEAVGGIEQFFTYPRLADKNGLSKSASDAVELSQDQAIWTALAFEDNEQLRQLLKRGADPNKPEALSLMTPLMAAETLPLAWSLLEAGADPRVRDRTGYTALHHATKLREAASILPLLVRAGGDINARSDEPEVITPLFCAVENYFESPDSKEAALVVRVLVRLGADLNATDSKGATVLALAASRNKPDLIKLLVELGADPTKRLPDGRTPLDYAKEANATDAVQLLGAAGTSASVRAGPAGPEAHGRAGSDLR
jgi:ankyrin repeat protein